MEIYLNSVAYPDIMATLSTVFKSPLEKGIITIPKGMGEGFIQGKSFEKGLFALQIDVTLKSPTTIFRKVGQDKSAPWAISFYLPNEAHKKIINGKKINVSSIFFFSSPSMGAETRIMPQVRFRELTIFMTPQWVNTYLDWEKGDGAGRFEALINSQKAFYLCEPISCDLENPLYQFINTETSPVLKQLFYKSKTLELVALAFEHAYQITKDKDKAVKKNDYTLQAKEILLRDITHAPNIPQMAQDLGVSQTKLRAGFKKAFGENMYRFLHRARMQRAAELLQEEELSIAEVGHRIGYSNISYFSEIFKKVYGILPSNYIKNKNNPQNNKEKEELNTEYS